MAQEAFVEAMRPAEVSTNTRKHPLNNQHASLPSTLNTASPVRAPRLMLVNGLGEVSSLPSPIVGGNSDDDSISDPDSPLHEYPASPPKSLSVPSIFDSPVKQAATRRDYSPSLAPMKPPPSPPKRNMSPPKMIVGNTEGKPRPNHRKGHRHKHSLSHQIFLPPPERPPLPLPAHIPVPTLREIVTHAKALASQFLPLVVHIVAIVYLIHTSTGEASLVALTFLALSDLFAGFAEVLSRIFNEFEVWRTASLRHPFGLQRIEGLCGFGLGVLGTFNGLYVLKETIEDIIISFGTEDVFLEGASGGHHHHHHYIAANPLRIGPGGIDLAVLMLFLSTLLLITILSPHSKTSKLLGMRVDYLTLTACTIIFLVPLLGIPPLHSIDRGISLVIAFSMIAVGLNTGKSWGSLLLCIPFKDEKPLIKQLPTITGVSEVKKHMIFQTSHRSGLAMFTLRLTGDNGSPVTDELETTIRERIARCLADWDRDIHWEYFVDFKR